MGRLCAVGRLRVAADLDLENVQRRAKVWQKQIVEDLAAEGLLVIDEQARRRAGAQRANAVKRQPQLRRHCDGCVLQRSGRIAGGICTRDYREQRGGGAGNDAHFVRRRCWQGSTHARRSQTLDARGRCCETRM